MGFKTPGSRAIPAEGAELRLRKMGFEGGPLREAALEALEMQGQSPTRSSLRALIRDLEQLDQAAGGPAQGRDLKALASLLAAARTAGVEVDPAALIRAASLGSEALPGWEGLLEGLRGAGLAAEARKLEGFAWKGEEEGAEELRRAVEGSGAFAESRWREGSPPPEDLKFELLKLRDSLRSAGGRKKEELAAAAEALIGRIRELQRSFDLGSKALRIRAEVPGREGRHLSLAVAGPKTEGPLAATASLSLAGGGRVTVEILLEGDRLEARIRAPESLAGKLDAGKAGLADALGRRGLKAGPIRVSPEGT